MSSFWDWEHHWSHFLRTFSLSMRNEHVQVVRWPLLMERAAKAHQLLDGLWIEYLKTHSLQEKWIWVGESWRIIRRFAPSMILATRFTPVSFVSLLYSCCEASCRRIPTFIAVRYPRQSLWMFVYYFCYTRSNGGHQFLEVSLLDREVFDHLLSANVCINKQTEAHFVWVGQFDIVSAMVFQRQRRGSGS